MVNSNNRVIVNSVIYSFSGILLKCFSFFLLPLYTAYLTTEDYGVNSLVSSFIATASFIVAFSLFSAIMRFYVELKADHEKLKRFYGTISTFIFISGTVFGILITIFRKFIIQYLFPGIDYYPIVLVTLISLVFTCEHTVFDYILQSQQKAFKSALFSIIYFLITVALNILFVVHFKMGAYGTILAGLISAFLYTSYFVFEMLIKGTITICIDFKLLKSALKYSIPIMPHNLSTQIAIWVSKLLIGDTASLAHLGIYTVATQFGSIADTIQVYVDKAYGPWLYERLHSKDKDYKVFISRNTNLLVSVIGFFFLGISFFAHDYIILLIDKNYIQAWKYVPLIVSVYSIKTMYYFYVEILFYYKEASRKMFIATLSSSLINIVLSYFLIPIWGVVGSIVSDAISMVLRVLIVYCISRKYEDIGLKLSLFLRNFIIINVFIAAGLSLSFFRYQETFSFLNFMFKCIILLLYLLYVYITNKDQIRPAIAMIKNKLVKGRFRK